MNKGKVIWITGQPSAGKTTIAEELKSKMLYNAVHIDGTKLAISLGLHNFDYSSRVANVELVGKMAKYLSDQGHDVIVSMVSPYAWQRQVISVLIGPNEFRLVHVHTTAQRERTGDAFEGYEPPTQFERHLDVDTTDRSVLHCALAVYNYYLNNPTNFDPLPPAA